MKEITGYVHHIRGTTITLKMMRMIRTGGKERVEYSHIALPVKRDAEGDPDRDLVDKAVDLLDDVLCVAKVEGGFFSDLRKASVEETKKHKESLEPKTKPAAPK